MNMNMATWMSLEDIQHWVGDKRLRSINFSPKDFLMHPTVEKADIGLKLLMHFLDLL
jgi:hypothetical protein